MAPNIAVLVSSKASGMKHPDRATVLPNYGASSSILQILDHTIFCMGHTLCSSMHMLNFLPILLSQNSVHILIQVSLEVGENHKAVTFF